VLLDAWMSLCADESFRGVLLVAGTGALSFWSSRAKALVGAGRIQFLGHLAQPERLLTASDLLVSPARYDAYGLNVHEALCCRVPVLVTRGAGIAERLPPALSDFVLDEGPKASTLAARIRYLLGHAPAYNDALSRCSETLRTRTWRDAVSELVGYAEERESRASGASDHRKAM
jgi:glycosyltransferase involved in cell wall biosynthesis